MARRHAVHSRPGWTRLSAPGHKLSALWRHDASGWLVKHCGHPTANWPYYATDPADPEERTTVTHNGHGWRTLGDAFGQLEQVMRGDLVATNDSCGPRTRRVCRHDQVREACPVHSDGEG
jgi:hypothetical protein